MGCVIDGSGRRLFRGRIPRDASGALCRFAVRPVGGPVVYAPVLHEALTAVMGESYGALTPGERRTERISKAVRLASALQGRLAPGAPQVADAVLSARKDAPVGLAHWDCPTPLVLVDHVYAPHSDASPPVGWVMWLRPVDEWAFALSLQDAGLIDVAAHR